MIIILRSNWVLGRVKAYSSAITRRLRTRTPRVTAHEPGQATLVLVGSAGRAVLGADGRDLARQHCAARSREHLAVQRVGLRPATARRGGRHERHREGLNENPRLYRDPCPVVLRVVRSEEHTS